MNRHVRRFLPFFVLIVLVLILYVTNLHQAFTLENLQKEQHRLTSFVHDHPFTAPLLYIGIYIVSVCLIIPDSTILTLLAGMVFPLPLAVIYAVFSETVGASLFFFIFYSAFGKTLFQRERPFLNKMRKQFKRHGASYLLFLRISHVVPFWLTNLGAAYFRVRFWTFLWTCLIGVIPLTYVLADAGRSLSHAFASQEKISLDSIFTTQLKLSLLVMGLLAFVPILYKKFRKKRKWKK